MSNTYIMNFDETNVWCVTPFRLEIPTSWNSRWTDNRIGNEITYEPEREDEQVH